MEARFPEDGRQRRKYSALPGRGLVVRADEDVAGGLGGETQGLCENPEVRRHI